jgi:hypothetical protein
VGGSSSNEFLRPPVAVADDGGAILRCGVERGEGAGPEAQ